MVRILLLIAFALLLVGVTALVDVVSSPPGTARVLPRWVWGMLVVVLPLVGPVLWWTIGRPWRQSRGPLDAVEPPAPAPAAPPRATDAPENSERFLEGLSPEERIRRLEEALARLDDEDGHTDPPAPSAK